MDGAQARRVVVVGAGLGGLRTVEELRALGYAGALTLIGAEQHPPYRRPPLSKEVLRGEAPPEAAHLREPASYDELDVDLRLGRRAVALDPATRSVVLDDDSTVGYDRCVIATGATPRLLPGVSSDEVHVLRTIDDCVRLRDALASRPRVVVVGAGFIGSEVASSSRDLGCDVTVVEVMGAPLVHALGPEVGAACAGLQARAGVDLRCGVGVTAISEGSVRLDDGTVLAADLVVVGVGVSPEVGWLESSGITMTNGLVCDEFCATSLPDVYAVGDLARWHNQLFDESMRLEHWTNAAEQAVAVAHNVTGDRSPFAPIPYFWSDQFGTKIQVLGRPRADDEVRVVRGSLDEGKFVAIYGRGDRLVGVVGFGSARHVMSFRPLLATTTAYGEALDHATAS
jgi:NADPH-dependent 2,4-dienoyl-CoA reductase/sulfur reductase-like enzyme